MSSLSDLPDDILRLISFRLNGFDNCFLWMASDSNLKERLVNNVIVDFDIRYTIPGRYLWPGNFLKRLSKLSRLSLVVDDYVYHLPIQNIQLHPIPTLKYLILHFDESHRIFDQNRLISSIDSIGPTTSSDNNYINLNDYFGNLEHLEVISSWINSSFSIDFLHVLPQKLQTLSIPRTDFEMNHQNPTDSLNTSIGMLPPTLTSLDLLTALDRRSYYLYKNKAYLDSSKLPPNLTSLTTDLSLAEKSYDRIPRSLKSLLLNIEPYDLAKLAPHLPIGLGNLKISIQNTPTSQILSHLKNLETLSFESTNLWQLDDLIANCPPKLKMLHCYNSVTSLPNRIFGDSITQLSLRYVHGLCPEFMSNLPQSLTDLSLIAPDLDQPFAYFKLLPRTLKSLFTDLKVVENTSYLPESLTYLFLTSRSPDSSYFDRLPSKLETLVVQQTLPLSIMKQLPTSLTDIFVTCNEIVDDEIVRMLPRGLKEFSLKSQDKITDAGVADLPSSLIRLILDCNTSITDDAFELLPRSLTELNLPLNPNFTDKSIKHLPRRMLQLSLPNATNITSKSCKDLPKHLSDLNFKNCHDWDPEMLIASKNELPQFIEAASLANYKAAKAVSNIYRKSLGMRGLF